MGKDKRPLWLTILALAAVLYLINPVKIIPAIIKLRLKGVLVAFVLVLALVAVIIYFAFKQSKTSAQSEEQQLNKQIETKGRQRIVQLRNMGMHIKNSDISSHTEEICKSVEKMLFISEQDTDKFIRASQFIDNYLITLGSVLTKYARLETNNSLTDDVTANAIGVLEKIKKAADNHTQNILKSDMMDIDVEIETLLTMAKRDGLLAEEGFSFAYEDERISLVL